MCFVLLSEYKVTISPNIIDWLLFTMDSLNQTWLVALANFPVNKLLSLMKILHHLLCIAWTDREEFYILYICTISNIIYYI